MIEQEASYISDNHEDILELNVKKTKKENVLWITNVEKKYLRKTT